jgi:hypothetical protein
MINSFQLENITTASSAAAANRTNNIADGTVDKGAKPNIPMDIMDIQPKEIMEHKSNVFNPGDI